MAMIPRRLATWICLPTAFMGCATRYLPPPAAPERLVPIFRADKVPVRDGEGTVTLDVVGGPARAEEVTGRETLTPGFGTGFGTGASWRRDSTLGAVGSQLTTRPLCITPCAVNLPLGPHEVQFSSLLPGTDFASTAFIHVGQQPTIVRHAMGYQRTHVGGILTAILLVSTGVTGVFSGAALVALGRPTPGNIDFGPAGWITLAVGGILTAVGIGLGYSSRPESRPGATTEWTPSEP